MDRTVIAPWKAEEKEHSEKLHEEFQGLALLYPMNDEMNKLLAWDMFLKPNQAAFFQVMNYLFRILDPVEFKKRFYWPITDKKAEALFRSSTVDYLKHLNEKHQLNWTNIKSYLVVMPGGMRFINFLLVLVRFVVQELIKQREKSLLAEGINISTLSDLTVQKMSVQNPFMKEYASGYIEELRQSTARYRNTTQKIRDTFIDIAKKTNVEDSLLSSDKFLDDFEAYNRLKYERKILRPTERIVALENPLCGLKDAMDQFLAKQAEQKRHQDAADNIFRSMKKFFGTSTGDVHATGNALISMLNNVSETIAEHLDTNDHYNESSEFVVKDLQELRDKLKQIEIQVNDVQKNLNLRAKEHDNNISGNTSEFYPVPSTPMRHLHHDSLAANAHPVLMKYVCTPPIKPDAAGAGTDRKVNLRLPLQDDFNSKQFDMSFNKIIAPAPPRSTRKPKPLTDQSMELNSTMNRSKLFDPKQLLRTIKKKTTPSQVPATNISNLGSKWKQLHASFGFDEPSQTVLTSPKSSVAIPPQSPFTPLNCNEHTRIERLPQIQAADTSISSLIAKSAAVMKVMDASLNVQNLSTSPSGRLDALVAGPLPERKSTPILQLNDKTLNDSLKLIGDIDVRSLNPQPTKLNLSFLDNEDLQNVSDSVLNDIAF